MNETVRHPPDAIGHLIGKQCKYFDATVWLKKINAILKEHESGIPVLELCRKHGVSDGTVYKWKAK